MSGQNKLWGGRFSDQTDDTMERFSESVSFDNRLFARDIEGSIAHATMLGKVGVLDGQDVETIVEGLEQIGKEIEAGDFEWNTALEDVHMNIEAALTSRVGDAGKRLHTGRSRNDQIATDMRLYLREQIDLVSELLTGLQHSLVSLAEQEAETVFPGFTHMQAAQPVTFGHHMLAWNQMLERDYQRLQECRARVNVSPLGCAALAGTSYPIDREMTADLLGFDSPAVNSLDAVSDRDFIMEFLADGAMLMTHFSRMAEEMVLWSNPAFGFVDLGDRFCTGSSIMPQKKNPDVAELTRGKSGRVIGNLMSLLVLVKGQPLTYNRDNQEDKEPLFDTIDTLVITLRVLGAMMPQITVKRDVMLAAASAGYSTATDLADYLVKQDMPFRSAHEVVGKVVASAERRGLELKDMPLEDLKQYSELINEDVYDILDVAGSVAARDHIGGTAPAQVRKAAAAAGKLLDARSAVKG